MKTNNQTEVLNEVLPGDSVGDFFFWLGADANGVNIKSVTENEFAANVQAKRQENERFFNVGDDS